MVFFVKLYSVQRVNWTRKKHPEHSISLVHPETIAQQNFLTLALRLWRRVAVSGGEWRRLTAVSGDQWLWHKQQHWLRRLACSARRVEVTACRPPGRLGFVLCDFRRDLLPCAAQWRHAVQWQHKAWRSGNTRRGVGMRRGRGGTQRWCWSGAGMRRCH